MKKVRIIAREENVIRVDFRREPPPPAPGFPGGSAQRVAAFDDISTSIKAEVA